MEVLFGCLFFLWVLIPSLFEYSQTGAKSFVVITVMLWVLAYFMPESLLVSCWLFISMILGAVVASINFGRSGKKFLLWLMMAVVSAIMLYYLN